MKFTGENMSLDILKGQIKNNDIKNIYLFYGAEEYLKKYYIDLIEKKVVREDFKTMNKIVFEGKVDLNKLTDACETVPLFSEKKLVIVKNTGLFKQKKKTEPDGSKASASKDKLLAALQSIPSYTCVIFYEEEIDKRLKSVDFIKKNGLIVEFPFQKPVELVKWVIKVFKSNNKEIGQDLASELVNSSEQGMNEILNEVNKLVAFLGDREKLTHEDIEKVLTKSVKSRIFDLTDAIAQKEISKTYEILEEITILKEPMPKILFMIARQFRQILEIKLYNEAGMGSDEIARKMGLHPFIAGKIQKQSKHFDTDTLKRVIKESLELDVEIKTGKINDRLAVEILLAMFSS